MAQGAAQSIEDGATFAACLAADQNDIAEALRRYERLRLPRASRVQALAAGNKTRLHLPDGPEQIARDAELANGTAQFALQDNAWLYGHDATRLSDA
jgi:salicylate hydroxylase